MTFAFIATHRGMWPAGWLCEALGVSRAGLYAWRTRSPSARARANEQLLARVRASFLASDRTYGARRVWHDLLGGRSTNAVAPNVLDRTFTAALANRNMGRRLHRPLDRRRLALRRGGGGSLLATGRRLVHACDDDHPTCHRCPRDGDLATRQARGRVAPL